MEAAQYVFQLTAVKKIRKCSYFLSLPSDLTLAQPGSLTGGGVSSYLNMFKVLSP